MENMVTKKQHDKILKDICPDCDGELHTYACGGLSINKQCRKCGAKFNDMFVFGSQRLSP